MDKQEMLALAERVEGLAGPDREVDELIADALFTRSRFAQIKDAPVGTGCMMWWQDGQECSALRYTASLDAAMTLVPEGWYITALHQGFRGHRWKAQLSPMPTPALFAALDAGRTVGWQTADSPLSGDATLPSAALALTAACLRAHASTLEKTDD